MKLRFEKCLTVIMMLTVLQAGAVAEALARGAAFSFDSLWFYRDGIRVVPEISRRWLTVAFDPRSTSGANGLEPDSDTANAIIGKKAKAMVAAHRGLMEYLYDPNLAENACFFRMRGGLKPEDVRRLISQLNQDRSVAYVHPALILNNKTFAYFNEFQLEWKTGTSRSQRESLLRATHAALDEDDDKELRYRINVAVIPFFRALNLLAEDVRVLKVTPRLVEIKPTISSRLSLFMSGGNIGDSIPFTLTVAFSDRVNIDPSSLATPNLRPPELQKELFDCTFDPYDYARSAAKSPIVISGRMRFYAPGEFRIPAVKINYSCPSCPDSGVRALETEPVPFRVSSIIPAVKSENRLIVPTDPVAPDFRLPALHQEAMRHLWFAIAAFAGLIPCALWAYFLRPRVTRERDRKEERKRAEQVAGQLRVLLFGTPTVPHWHYLGQVGILLREYATLRYGIDARYRGGSGRQFMETVAPHVPAPCLAPLGRALCAIDDCVARESEQFPEMEELRRDILDAVELIGRDGGAG